MMQLITTDSCGACADELADMHRLRYRIFKQRLDWDVQASGDMEVDEFDALGPCYLLQRSAEGAVTGCVRLLPTTGPTMLRDTFGALLDGTSAPAARVSGKAAGSVSIPIMQVRWQARASPRRPTSCLPA